MKLKCGAGLVEGSAMVQRLNERMEHDWDGMGCKVVPRLATSLQAVD